jgi:hypothetical protein
MRFAELVGALLGTEWAPVDMEEVLIHPAPHHLQRMRFQSPGTFFSRLFALLIKFSIVRTGSQPARKWLSAPAGAMGHEGSRSPS